MKLIRLLLFVIVFHFVSNDSRGQDIDFGVGTTIAFRKAIFGLQGKVAYDVNDKLSLVGTYNYYFRENVNYAVEGDVRFRLFSVQEYSIHPLVGINLNRVGTTRVSFNTGLFIRVDRDLVDIYLEPKFVLDDLSYFVLSGGLWF